MKTLSFSFLIYMSLFISCSQKSSTSYFIEKDIKSNEIQQTKQINAMIQANVILHLRSLDENGTIRYAQKNDWTSGFYTGILWHTYDLTIYSFV